MHVHLEGEQNVLYPDGATPQQREELAEAAISDLVQCFQRPAPTAFTQPYHP